MIVVPAVRVGDGDRQNYGACHNRYHGADKNNFCQRQTVSRFAFAGDDGHHTGGLKVHARLVSHGSLKFEDTGRVYIRHFIHRDSASGTGDRAGGYLGDGTIHSGAVDHFDEFIALFAVQNSKTGSSIEVDFAFNGIAALTGFKQLTLQLTLL